MELDSGNRCSECGLVGVGPFDARSDNASICRLISKIGYLLHQAVCSFELAPIECGTVTNDDLRGVLVGHDDCRLR